MICVASNGITATGSAISTCSPSPNWAATGRCRPGLPLARTAASWLPRQNGTKGSAGALPFTISPRGENARACSFRGKASRTCCSGADSKRVLLGITRVNSSDSAGGKNLPEYAVFDATTGKEAFCLKQAECADRFQSVDFRQCADFQPGWKIPGHQLDSLKPAGTRCNSRL